jgi:hypothetical protein
VRLECVKYGDTPDSKDYYATATAQHFYYGHANIQNGLYSYSYTANTNTRSWNGYTYTIDIMKNTFQYNVYTENYATNSKGIVDLAGMPRVFFNHEVYTNNGDASANAINYINGVHGSTIISPSPAASGQPEMTIDSALSSSV